MKDRIIIGVTSNEICNALEELAKAVVELQNSLKINQTIQKEYLAPRTKFGKGDRRKNKKQFMNQINRKR